MKVQDNKKEISPDTTKPMYATRGEASPVNKGSLVAELFSGRGERLIRVMVADVGVFLPKTFPKTEVEGVLGLADDQSALVLRSGVKIPVALPYEQLEQKLYQPDFKNDDPVLDLRNVTGEAARPKAPSNTNRAFVAPGDKMPDGTVFAGFSPDTKKPMYWSASPSFLWFAWNQRFSDGVQGNHDKGNDLSVRPVR